ncbi:MAG: hypothetical protein KJO07_19300 [Deltaproteobacteria bacterium]|nr:hypothetical protein [Deltaproteobacteria bacterium]
MEFDWTLSMNMKPGEEFAGGKGATGAGPKPPGGGGVPPGCARAFEASNNNAAVSG